MSKVIQHYTLVTCIFEMRQRDFTSSCRHLPILHMKLAPQTLDGQTLRGWKNVDAGAAFIRCYHTSPKRRSRATANFLGFCTPITLVIKSANSPRMLIGIVTLRQKIKKLKKSPFLFFALQSFMLSGFLRKQAAAAAFLSIHPSKVHRCYSITFLNQTPRFD